MSPPDLTILSFIKFLLRQHIENGGCSPIIQQINSAKYCQCNDSICQEQIFLQDCFSKYLICSCNQKYHHNHWKNRWNEKQNPYFFFIRHLLVFVPLPFYPRSDNCVDCSLFLKVVQKLIS